MGQHAKGDWGYRTGLEASAVGLAAASMLASGHAHAMARVHAEREAREQAAYDTAVYYSLQNARELEALARELADQVVALTAENAKLKRNLQLREAAITAMRAQRL